MSTNWIDAAVTAPADDKSTQAENELICEKLLGWTGSIRNGWRLPSGEAAIPEFATPTFTTWAEAGLILEALQDVGARKLELSIQIGRGELTPQSIRSAALSYLRSLER